MPTPQAVAQAVARVHDQASLLNELLVGALDWPLGDEIERIDDIAHDWSEDLFGRDLDRTLIDGQAWQIRTKGPRPPWGLFLLQFTHVRGYRTLLRRALRGLVPNRRRSAHLPAWDHENLLFICTTKDYDRFTFAHFRGDKPQTARLTTFGWQAGDRHLRTLCDHNLPHLEWPTDGGREPAAWLAHWSGAFDVEAVTKRFFAEYRAVFEQVEAGIKGVPKGEPRRLYVQRLFNRLMFLYFTQRKGWLSFQGDKNYLRALFNAATAAKEDFLNDRLYWTFFYGLNTAGEDHGVHSDARLQERRGVVPFLNGGLFDLEDEYDVKGKVQVPAAAFAAVLDLFEHYNFTVTESTPFDVEVAVDPEILGKVFEELVTGRHESGSYYTPRPIVAFMCREALKHYLLPSEPEASAPGAAAAVARFVDEGDPAGLADPEAVLDALRAVKVCDPACGSGAYLLGMMQELLRLRDALFVVRGLDDVTVYRRKLEIIENNLYGVDIDTFAVNIAKLRLWLSLAVDFVGTKPPPLPNLDFKIECGDSLTAPNPQEMPDLFRGLLVASADRLADLKSKYLSTYGPEKQKLNKLIKAEEKKLREGLQDESATGSVDWRVAFAEVFRNGGFDIALENPPYVRMELFKAAKPILSVNFPTVYDGSADLYVYFYARTQQILRPGGTACVISSDKWLKAGYGESLRRFFADSTWVEAVVDFGHAKQIFQDADVFPMIMIFRKPNKATPPQTTRVCAIPREQLQLDDLTRQVQEQGFDFPRSRLTSDAWSLEPASVYKLLDKIRQSGVPLKDYAKVVPLYGIKTGCNDAYVVDDATRAQLIAKHPSSDSVLKPFLRGRDLDRWHAEYANLWLVYVPWHFPLHLDPSIGGASAKSERLFAQQFPAIYEHLLGFKKELTARNKAETGIRYEWYALQRWGAEYWRQFERKKLCIQRIAFHSRVSLDNKGYYLILQR